MDIKPDDLRIDTYRSGGPGGQHVNRTDLETGRVDAVLDGDLDMFVEGYLKRSGANPAE